MSKSGIIPSGAYQRNTFSIGLMIALTSWSLILFTILWGYVIYRMKTTVWLHDYLSPAVFKLACINTVMIVCSTLALRRGLRLSKAMPWIWSSIGLGVVFLVGQLELWKMILANGLDWHKTLAGGFFFLLTGFHGAHIVGALPALVALALRLDEWREGSISVGIRCFWDLLLVVWMILFVLIFVIQ